MLRFFCGNVCAVKNIVVDLQQLSVQYRHATSLPHRQKAI